MPLYTAPGCPLGGSLLPSQHVSVLLTLKALLQYCLPDKASPDSQVGSCASARCVVSLRQLCEHGHPLAGPPAPRGQRLGPVPLHPPQCPGQPGLEVVETPLGSLDYVLLCTYLLVPQA